MPLVTSGVEHGNLRELALARMKDLGTECRDVRTREVGIQEIHHKVKPYEVCDTLNCYSLFCDFSHLDLTILTFLGYHPSINVSLVKTYTIF